MVISSRTKNNLTFRIWNDLNKFKEESYFKIYLYTIVFHTLYALLIITLIKTSLTCPGFLDSAYVFLFNYCNFLIISKLENFELNEDKCYQGLSRSNDENSGPYRTNENLEKSIKDDCPHFKGKEFFKYFEKIEDQSNS